LNQQYSGRGISFVNTQNLIKVVENQEYLLNKDEALKERLKNKFDITFDNTNKWHISGNALIKLKVRKIKMKSTRLPESLIKGLTNLINMIKEEELRTSILTMLNNYPQYFICPASIFYHHDYKYGLLEHTIQTTEIAIQLYHKYLEEQLLNKDLILAGSILHDFGKINCFGFDKKGNITKKDIYFIQGHIMNTIKIISQEIKSNILDDILHIIGSHHRLKEWGSPITPITLEAWIVHFADDASSKIG